MQNFRSEADDVIGEAVQQRDGRSQRVVQVESLEVEEAVVVAVVAVGQSAKSCRHRR